MNPARDWIIHAPPVGAMQATINVVSAAYGMTAAEMLAKSRKRRVCRPRMIAITIARETFGATLTMIAARFGCDHTTAINAIRRVHERMTPEIRADMDRLAALAKVMTHSQANKEPDA